MLAWCLSAMRTVKSVLTYKSDADEALDDALQRASKYGPSCDYISQTLLVQVHPSIHMSAFIISRGLTVGAHTE